MGITETTTVTVTCPACGEVETRPARRSDSGYGLASWSGLGEFTSFTTTIAYCTTGPQVDSATCKRCVKPATVVFGA